MTRNLSSALALTFAALLAGPAMAANTDAPVTRAQIKAELAEAVRTGNIAYDESGIKLNEVFPHHYISEQQVSRKTREQVKAELVEAVRTGNVINTDSGMRLNELYPQNYPAQQNVASKTRDQVKSELAEARSNGSLYNPEA